MMILPMSLCACAHTTDRVRTTCLKQTAPADDSVRVTWMGTAGLYVSDGDTGIYIDPFVSRYGLLKVGLGVALKPQNSLIDEWITLTHGQNAAAILVSHSHYDHVMDVPRFALKTGAMIVGSKTTANVALGAGIPKEQIKTITGRDTVSIGKFEITFIQSIHSPALFGKIPWPGTLEYPLPQPAPASAYREGGVYAILVKHPKGTFLHYGSPGVKPGIFEGIAADVVFLSIGGRKDTGSLIDHVLTPLHPETVIPIHFDDLFGPVDKEIKPLIGVDLNEFWTRMAKTEGTFTVNTLPVGEERVLFY
ncbi:MAG: MBL fold metallo-hydrolase [Desulfosalsimonadaceae bacterium]